MIPPPPPRSGKHDQADIVSYLDRYLRIEDVPDYDRAVNGLQVANSGRLSKLVVAVDACQATIDAAAAAGGDLLMVHHGLFWAGLQPLTGPHGARVRALVRHDIALYAAHIPLDCHPEVGNNSVLARALELKDLAPFGAFQGIEIGIVGSCAHSLGELATRLETQLGREPRVLAHGPATCHRVAVVTGAGSDLLGEAATAGVDTFITGEAPHHAFFVAEEAGINLVLAGHYATETVGVQALARHLEKEFGLPWEFVDHPTGL